MDNISLLIGECNGVALVLAKGSEGELSDIISSIGDNLCEGNCRVITVDTNKYIECNNDIIKLRELISNN